MENARRNFVQILTEICQEQNIEIQSFSYNWIFRLSKGDTIKYVIGYRFDLNSASTDRICSDKSAASDLMESFGIPNVPHWFFMSPVNQKYIGGNGNWCFLLEKLENYGELVCKPNDGTGGGQVFKVKTPYELELATSKIFSKSRSMAVSPYYIINNEYRVIVLENQMKLIYYKQRPYIIGDGKSSVRDLVFEQQIAKPEASIANDVWEELDLDRVLAKNNCIYLNWRHNLGQGSSAVMVDNNLVKEEIKYLSEWVSDKLNLRFASIDIIECDGSFRILEINSGVMMEHFSMQGENEYRIAKSIYRDAVSKMFE